MTEQRDRESGLVRPTLDQVMQAKMMIGAFGHGWRVQWDRLRRPGHTWERELMDQPGHSPATIRQNLRDLVRVNRWIGGVRLSRRGLQRLLESAGVPANEPVCILDVGTGAADIPRALLGWAWSRGCRLHVVAVDVSPAMLRAAAERGDDSGRLRFAAADGARLPFADGTFDVAMSSLTLHHMDSEVEAVALVRELRRVSRIGFVVNDIVRGWPGYLGAWLLARLCSRSRLTWHDGPLSVRRAFTTEEMWKLAAAAGAPAIEFEHFVLYRVAMIWRRA